MACTVNKKALYVLEFAKTESIVTVQRRFRTMYRTEPPTDKTIREWHMKFQQRGCLCAAKRRGRPGPMALAGLFVSQRTGGHSAGISCTTHELFVRRWFCAVHGPKPPLHRHNWLSFGKFQDTERFLIHCARHFSSRLPLSGGTCKYAKAPSTKKTLRDSLPIDMLLSAASFLVVAQSSSEVAEGLMNNPVLSVTCSLTMTVTLTQERLSLPHEV